MVKVEFSSLLVHFSELKPLLLMRESCRVYFADYYDDGDEITRGEMEQMCRGNLSKQNTLNNLLVCTRL